MKKTTLKKISPLLFFLLLITSQLTYAQCIRPNAYLTVTSNNSGNVQNIGTCSYTSAEFNTINGLIVGGTYQFISRTGATYGAGTENFVTITDTSDNVIAFGTSPLTVNALTVTSVRLHHATDAACGGAAVCNNSQLQYLPTCGIPSGLSSSAFTTTSATISWTAPTTAPSDGYQYYYATTNTAPTAATTPSGSVGAGITTADLTSLSVGTQYYFWVRSNCGSETSAWSASATFATTCLSTTVPYTQDFEAITPPLLPTCTSAVNYGTGNIWSVTNNPGNGFTTNTLRYPYSFSAAADTWFFTQGIEMVAGTSYRISYNYGCNSTFYTERMKVAYGVSANASDMTNVLFDHTAINTAVLEFNQVDFTPTADGVYYFGFQAYSIANQFNIHLDNITIDFTPACSAPISLATSGLTFDSVTVNWAAVATATNYEYVLDTVATDPTGAGTSIATNTFSSTTLSPSTTYYFHVRTDCSGTFSTWSTISFTTPATPPANDDCLNAVALTIDDSFCDGVNNNGTNVAATDSGVSNPSCFNYGLNDVWFSVVIPADVATIDVSTDFTGGTNVDTEIELYSGACGALVEVACDQDSGTTILSNGSSYNSVITDAAVTGGQTYYVRVAGYSPTTVGTFCLKVSTNTLSNDSFDASKFKFYPNPVKDVLNLSYTENITKVQVINLLGQEVKAVSINATQSQVDMSNLPKGTYLVKVTAADEVKTIKVIKQ
jgi:hypothetical protein